MSQKFRQILNGLLCLVCIECNEGIDVVQCVEQEVRIQLVTQVVELGFHAALLCLLPCRFRFLPLHAQADDRAQSCHEDVHDTVFDEKSPTRWMVKADKWLNLCIFPKETILKIREIEQMEEYQ